MSRFESDRLVEALRVYLVTDARIGDVERLAGVCCAAIEGGVTAIQLRAKGWSDRNALEAAVCLRELCDAAGVMFLVNDRVDIALASRADGVHLGVDDLPVATARELLGERAIIGYSPDDDESRAQAVLDGADYLGVGPVYATATKDDAGPALGIERFAGIVAASDLPVIGIGGISAANAGAVRRAGAVGVAVVSAVLFADDPAAAAREIAAVMARVTG
jgi:thiamine-phosphate diphosphorylase